MLLASCGGGNEASGLGPVAGATPPVAPAPAPAPGVVDAARSCGLASFQADLMAQINQARQSGRVCGGQSMPPVVALAWNDPLFSGAAKHAEDMAVNNYFSHTSLDGRTLGQRVTAEAYNWRAVGENIAAGHSSVSAVMQGWLTSDGHCRNIMNSNFRDVGVACVNAQGAQYSRYWVMKLGAR
ncbi:CAP domain-containing protein [Hydrogenophaga sp.]|uniref:CAP domain-containing protein n=1 Tax=Hydrogenophaga sp. TaxID=1904254 RepID=UPI002C33047C|nr:CAP domain-containing protein [Hydrogenophaga sp.]HMP10974.1 CAP domain-containing protein [Hydrogenophaga sp.]